MFSLAIHYNPTASQYYENRSKTFRKLRNLKTARKDLICMLILDPNNQEVRSSSHFPPDSAYFGPTPPVQFIYIQFCFQIILIQFCMCPCVCSCLLWLCICSLAAAYLRFCPVQKVKQSELSWWTTSRPAAHPPISKGNRIDKVQLNVAYCTIKILMYPLHLGNSEFNQFPAGPAWLRKQKVYSCQGETQPTEAV